MVSNDNLLNVSPDMGFYNLLESYPYNLTRALCEYIDNALQAFLDKDKKFKQNLLKIELNFCNDLEAKITIKDNGVGIQKQDFQRVMRPGMKKDTPSLSEFGIGMKAASLWFGRKWELQSSPWNSTETYGISFDLDELLKKNQEQIELMVLPREKENGVVITISRLKRKIEKELVEKAWKELQDIYQLFTHVKDPILKLSAKYNNVTLRTDDDLLNNYRNPEVLEYPRVRLIGNKYYAIGNSKKWEQNISFEFEGNMVTGKLYALHTSSQKSNPGIRLFRNKRLIKGFLHNSYRPAFLVGTANKHAPSRIFGELHLDGQAISSNKGEFQFEEDYFLMQLSKQCGVRDLIDQAEAYRAKQDNKNIIPISEQEFEQLKSKNNTPKIKKAIFDLVSSETKLTIGKKINLYDYISKAIDGYGNHIPYNKIDIRINDEKKTILPIVQPGTIVVNYTYKDEKDTLTRTLTITAVEKEADLENVYRPLIPHKAGDVYKLNLSNQSVTNLIEQINKLHREHKGEYNELIACSLRSVFELCIRILEKSSKITFEVTKNNIDKLEGKVNAIHTLMNNPTIAGKITLSAKLPSQQDFLNEWRAISSQDISSYVKSTHLGAHGSTSSLTPDRLIGIGNYLGLFILATDQILNNTELQKLITNPLRY